MPIEQFLIRRPKGVPHADFCVDLERVAAQFDLASCLDGKFTQVSAHCSAYVLQWERSHAVTTFVVQELARSDIGVGRQCALHHRNRSILLMLQVPHVLSASPWVVYKGFTPPDTFKYVFTDMLDSDFSADAALGHGRFATNSEPTLQSVQPTRYFVHNGEVNNIALLDVAMRDKSFRDYLGKEVCPVSCLDQKLI